MEGDAGTSRLNPIEGESTSVDTSSVDPTEDIEPAGPVASRRTERMGRGWIAGLVALISLGAVGIAGAGYLSVRADVASDAVAADESLALERAKECVAATQAPDVAAITASQTKIIECGTGNFALQTSVYSSVLVEAYQAANVSVKVSDLRAAVERYNPDRSVDVLVAVRVMVTNSQVADVEQGYRLRVQMAPADGTYKIAKLDQVTS